MGTGIELILTSPYLRAADTARILHKKLELKKDKLVELQELRPGGDAMGLVRVINESYGPVQNIALVGHEPGLSRLISVLISGQPDLPITLKKGGVCYLSVDKLKYGRCATLEWLMAPAQLTSIAT